MGLEGHDMKKLWLTVCIVLTIFLMGGFVSADARILASTGEPAPDLVVLGSPVVCTPTSDTCLALWDTSHGLEAGDPSVRDSIFISLLTSQGYPVEVSDAGVLNVDLSKYKVLIVAMTTTFDSAYTPEEVTAIKNFVDNGGKLLIMGDNTDCPNENINPVSEAFGTTVGLSSLTPLDLTITNLASHPAFTGVSSVYFRAGGEISSSGTIAWTPDNLPAINTAESNRVIIIGDSNLFDDSYIGNADNQKLALSLWKDVYCPVPEFPTLFLPMTLIIGLLGAVLVIQRTKEH